ncbi:NfeD family protein [Vibrio sp. ZSDZ34]|jgi:membrane protein implicated in regulation of membrane protease activity|uniref:NfeD family protein n=1 Tax=Vibrio gelatinilyticus TaxID=2893468 RepID=A0A9X1W7X2_9VIBR|nr:NfeD family protein [Vibrio gelatinilyticus]MCJ2375648.1 NfeD family protein [Vibrio gelatinilyticus]
MIELLSQVNYWHWLALGLLLLCGELLGTAGYMLWLGISAMLVGIVMTFIPMSWQLQWVSFGVFALALTWLWWRKQLKQDASSDQRRDLNQKQKQLIGQTTRLEYDILRGRCRIKLGDTTWAAQSDQDLPAGTLVKVIDVDGITLFIDKA